MRSTALPKFIANWRPWYWHYLGLAFAIAGLATNVAFPYTLGYPTAGQVIQVNRRMFFVIPPYLLGIDIGSNPEKVLGSWGVDINDVVKDWDSSRISWVKGAPGMGHQDWRGWPPLSFNIVEAKLPCFEKPLDQARAQNVCPQVRQPQSSKIKGRR